MNLCVKQSEKGKAIEKEESDNKAVVARDLGWGDSDPEECRGDFQLMDSSIQLALRSLRFCIQEFSHPQIMYYTSYICGYGRACYGLEHP